jgi:hypothetical protein
MQVNMHVKLAYLHACKNMHVNVQFLQACFYMHVLHACKHACFYKHVNMHVYKDLKSFSILFFSPESIFLLFFQIGINVLLHSL